MSTEEDKHEEAISSFIEVVLVPFDSPEDSDECKCVVSISKTKLARFSGYFAAMLESGMAEAQNGRVALTVHDGRRGLESGGGNSDSGALLDWSATQAVLTYLRTMANEEAVKGENTIHDDDDDDNRHQMLLVKKDEESLLLPPTWDGFRGWDSEDGMKILEVVDYLQISEANLDLTCRAIQFLQQLPDIRNYGMSKGWIDPISGDVRALPVGKKQRSWRFWFCYFLCLQIVPDDDGSPLDQQTFTSRLDGIDGSGGSIVLRRELVEYGLIAREADGSAYWRPPYGILMLRKKVDGMPRRIV